MALVVFQYEPVNLDVTKSYFEVEQDIPNTREKSRKVQAILNGVDVRKCGIMHTNLEYLSCGEVEALGYFQSSDAHLFL